MSLVIAPAHGGVDVGTSIANSLLFDSGALQYLNRTYTSSATWSFSAWVKRSKLGVAQPILEGAVVFNAGDTITAFGVTTTAVFRDTTAWYHIVASNSGLYVNGVNYGALTTTARTNSRLGYDGATYFEGYLSRVEFVDGTALAATAFGHSSADTGQWVPSGYSGSYGTTGYRLIFSDATNTTTLGADTSGNGNNWTLNAMTTANQYPDTPSLNYASLTPLMVGASVVISKGATKAALNGGGWTSAAISMAIPATGSWYVEFTVVTYVAGKTGTGIYKDNGMSLVGNGSSTGANSSSWYSAYGHDTNYYHSAASTPGHQTYSSNGDVIMMAFDSATGKVWWGKNGTWDNSGNPATGANAAYSGVTSPCFFVAEGYGGAVWSANAGQKSFAYTPPTGFSALNTSTLPQGTVSTSGSFTGNAAADGSVVPCNGYPTTLTINGNAVTFATHADRLATGFKLRTASASYNASGANTWTATVVSNTKNAQKYARAQANP